jgi:ferrous iron transport protein A
MIKIRLAKYYLGDSMRIKDLKVGDKAVVSGYEKGNSEYRTKLLSMGLTRGVEFTLTKIAPMGDPVELEVRGFSLSLRKSEAEVLILGEVE